MLPTEALEQSETALQMCDILMVVGTSAQVYPAAAFPQAAQSNGAYVIEINFEETPVTPIANASILGRAGEILPELVRAIQR